LKIISKYFKKVITPVDIKGWISNLLIAIPRIVGGLLLSIDFGSSKFGMPWTDSEKNLSLFEVASWFPEDVAKFGFPFSLAPVFFALMAAASEAIGGLFLAIGLKTRIAAFLIGCTMLVAIFFQKFGEGTRNMLPAMGFLWISIYSFVLGSGKFGVDYFLSKKIFNK
jgi:putative oxidoreductase